MCHPARKYPSVYHWRNRTELLQCTPGGPCEPSSALTGAFLSYNSQDIEICVPDAYMPMAVSVLHSTGQFCLEKKQEYDIFTEYKRGHPTFRATLKMELSVVLFPDTSFHLSPMSQSVISTEEQSNSTFSPQVLDVIAEDDIKYLPFPRLVNYLIGLCQRYFEANDDMARIAAEQLVNSMKLDEEWLHMNMADATTEVQNLMAMLVNERSSSGDEFLHFDSLTGADGTREEIRWIPGSRFH